MEKPPLRRDLHGYSTAALRGLRSHLLEQGVPEYGDLAETALRDIHEGKIVDAQRSAKAVLELAWEELHIGDWKDVSMVWRDLYALGALLSAMCALATESNDCIARAVAFLDKGILMGGPSFHAHFAALISELVTTSSVAPAPPPKRAKPETASRAVALAPEIRRENAIARISKPSMEQFFESYMKPHRPVIITDAMQHWPAVERWRDVEYIRKIAGMRVVPVEVGKTYLSEEWGQRLITMSEFIDRFILHSDESPAVGYVAQTKLFDQIPELRADIDTPAYCFLGEEDKDLAVNAWFGPVSPLHQDPHDNILAQAVGSKYIRLYDPQYTECVYPHQGKLLFNTSQVDIDAPDHEKFPRFSAAPYQECVLGAGEMLYIPRSWWHYVRSLEMSFSVSFWY